MSYRDLRNFTEMMRGLGYSRLISMENFRSPNFDLVAEILIWLVQRLDQNAEIHSEYTTEEDRVLLIRSAAQFMALKVNIILNTKRLYQADGYAVKELLKITTLLRDAMKANEKPTKNLDRNDFKDLTSKLQELKQSRQLASRIISRGAILYELLGKEVELRELRNSCLSNQFEFGAIEKALQNVINETRSSIVDVKSQIENISTTESTLDSKIEKKQTELERNEKRLQTLRKVRPAFLEEFEKHEGELESLFQEYVTRVRTISYLERQQEETNILEQERLQRLQLEARKLMEEIQMEDVRKLMEEDENGASSEKEVEAPKTVENRRLRTATGIKPRITNGQRRVYGGMNFGDEEDSIESDSDLLMGDDGDNSDFIESGDEMNVVPLEKNDSGQSDDDF